MEQHTPDRLAFSSTGTSRSQRTLPALLPDHVRIDDRSLPELLAFAAEYARLVRHYNDRDEHTGSWESFFTTDISVILASIISTDLESLEQEQQRLVMATSQSYQELEKYGHLLALCQLILDIARRVDTWYRQVARINLRYQGLEHEVFQELRNVIYTRLRHQLATLIAYDRGAAAKEALGEALGLSYEGLHALWEIDLEQVAPQNIYKGRNWLEKLDAALVQTRLLYRGFFNTLSFLVGHFRRHFEQSLQNKSDHKPDIGLFIAFLELFQHAQADLNALSSRHLAFYYDHLLMQPRREAIPDEAHVCFRLAPQASRYRLPAGTRLLAGQQPDGTHLTYTTLSDLEVTRAAITSLRTQYTSKHRRIEVGSSYQTVTGIYAAPVANSRDGQGAPFEDTRGEWPTFGEEQLDKVETARRMVETEIGLAISSPLFFLKEGKREITLTLQFINESASVYLDLMQDLAKNRYNGDMYEAFQAVFPLSNERRNLSLYYSGPRGWVEVPPFKVRIAPHNPSNEAEWRNWNPYQLVIQFDLEPGQPAFTGFDSQVHTGERMATRLPVLKIVLNHDVQPYAYSFLRDLELKSLDIEVSAAGLRDLHLYNEAGRLDGQQPFTPFGAMPAQGSYLLVGNSEIFRKPLTALSMQIDWHQIPPTSRHFNDLYTAYGREAGITWNSFMVGVSALSEHQFKPVDEVDRAQMPLFTPVEMDEAQEAIPLRRTVLPNLDLARLAIKADPELDQIGPYTQETQNGFIRLELTQPEAAFGHHIYQERFTQAITHNAQPKNQDAPVPVPGQPYTPMIKQLTLSYQARVRLDLSESGGREDRPEQLFHLHPFGISGIFSRGRRRIDPLHLLPQYHEDGYLYIGLRDVQAPETLSLLFQLTVSQTRDHSRFRQPAITWSYLTRNEWVPFAAEHHLLDTTEGFTRTGLVQLYLPRDISTRNDIMPAGTFWLRVAVSGDTEVLCHALDVRTQAVRARWVPDAYPDRLALPLPAERIRTLAQPVADIQAVTQPFPSFYGHPAEDDVAYFGRVSERLRHKNRAISPWDIERLVLDQFHTLQQVKCITHLTHPDYLEAGSDIVLAVVPGVNDSPDPRRPRVNFRTLREVQDRLAQHMTPFAHRKLKVRNPQYEFIRIYANMRFVEGANNGQTLQRLAQAVTHYLCPWMDDPAHPLNLGTGLSEDVLLNFIKGLDYVAGVWDFSLLHIWFDEDRERYVIRDTSRETDMVSIIQPRPWGVLIPDDDHQIRIIGPKYDEFEDAGKLQNLKSSVPFQGYKDITLDAEPYQIRIRRREAPKPPAANTGKPYTLKINL